MESLERMKKKFNEQMYTLKFKKGKNNQLFTKEEYCSFLLKLKDNKRKISGKSPEDYQRLSRYGIKKIGNIERLIVPFKQPNIYYTFLEENFQIIHDIHIAIGHSGRNIMMKKIKEKYKNITVEIVMIYLNLCEICKGHMSFQKTGVEKTIKSGQVNVIDMKWQPDNIYNFIMVYQDNNTKFIQLRALKTTETEEIAYQLLDIFTIFGAPYMLYSEHGEDFTNEIIGEVCKMWHKIKIINGKKKNGQSKSSTGKLNQEIKKMLLIWLETNCTTKWSEGLKFIQIMKNVAHHAQIRSSPYEAMFGWKLKV